MATQIRTFGMSHMTIGSCCDFHGKVLDFIKTSNPVSLHVDNKTAAYTTAVETLAAIVNRQRAFIATSAMKEADRTRDNAAGVISSVTSAYLTSPVAEKSAAARLLNPQLSPYKGIRNHEYTKQTAEVKGMLAVLNQSNNKDAIATLGLTEEVKALDTANAAFETAFLGKTAEMSTRIVESDAKSAEVIAEANSLYTEITQTVNAYAIVQPSDEITAFIQNINGLVGTYSRIAGSSKGSGSGPDGSGGQMDRPDEI